ncbi:hypothetical protein ANAEL_01088 [Anaerolineales bacterium]|nr:hypothetical protein ANAEL_01088 [Anaerolineales bacterium]
MKKTNYLMIVMTVFVVLFASACGGAAAQPPVESAPTQAPVQAAPTQAPVEPAAPAQTFAPACQAAASCAAPAVVDTVASDRYCVDKVPYQNIFVDDGVTFEVLEPDKLTCADNGTMVDGKRVVECHGTENWASKVRFTNTACSGASLQTGTGQCQEGLGYDAAQNCCAPLAAGDAGSVTITVNMGECAY